MPVKTPDELRDCLSDDPQASPAGFLSDDSFAAWCYDHRTLREMRSAFQRDADPEECRSWGLSRMEWKNQVAIAVIALEASKILEERTAEGFLRSKKR